MPTFPRSAGALPRLATPPMFPMSLRSWGGSNKGQFRSTQNQGRMWTEIYPLLDTANPSVRALIQAINQGLREGTVWSVQHPYWHVRKGAGGGTPIVNGANQTGTSLVVSGAAASQSAWLKRGDIIQVTGCAVVYDVAADVSTDGFGAATITIQPPIFVGGSPSNAASVVINPASIYFNAVLSVQNEPPQIDATGFIDAGMTLLWREQPV